MRYINTIQYNTIKVCWWFSSMLREVFLWVLRFSPLLKNQHFQIPIRSRLHSTNSNSVEVPLKIAIITIIIIITKVGLLPPTCTWIRSLMATFCKEPVPSCFPIIFTCNKDSKRSNLQPGGNKLKKKKKTWTKNNFFIIYAQEFKCLTV